MIYFKYAENNTQKLHPIFDSGVFVCTFNKDNKIICQTARLFYRLPILLAVCLYWGWGKKIH